MKYCTEYAALLDLFADGELDAAEMERVQAHLDGCPGCRAYVDDALLIRAAFPDAEDVDIPEGFAESVMERIRADSTKNAGSQKKERRWLRTLAPLAACCALVVVLSNGPRLFGGGNDAGLSGGAPCVSDTSGASAGAGGAVPYAMPAETPLEDAGAPEAEVETDTTNEFPEVATARQYEDDAEDQRGVLSAAPAAPGGSVTESALDHADGKFPILALSAKEAGDLLNDWTLKEELDGIRRYVLTAEQYETLLAILAENEGGAHNKAEQPETPDGEIMIEVTGPF